MAGARYPITLVGGVPVVQAPRELDARSAEWFRKVLLQAAFAGNATVVVNLADTEFCDVAGVHVLVSAHQWAVAKGGELLLVLPADAAVRRVFELTGIDFLIPRLADLNQALQQAHAVLPAS
jgi:anti-anti-sigma factor